MRRPDGPCGTLGAIRREDPMPPYRSVAEKPDHAALEHAILDLWEREGTFEQLRDGRTILPLHEIAEQVQRHGTVVY